jgi:N-acetylglucosaminyldiphosphoundecaprenol N-acetyl-beta-D-mannosaminyltransferase
MTDMVQLQSKSTATVEGRRVGFVIGVPIDALGWDAARQRLMGWARQRSSRYVCICNVHSVVTARQDPSYLRVVQEADMATPDGAPVAWSLRRAGFVGQPRVNGPDLMWKLCTDAEREGLSVGFHGSTPQTLDLLRGVLSTAFPRLRIAYCVSPPFRQLSEAEDTAVCDQINASGVGLLFVGLGCPKQEQWMAAHRGRVSAVMLGVGAAFDYHAGTISRAPDWMRSVGLEWFHRLCSEPRRLWRRYLVTNSLFIWHTAVQALRGGSSAVKP